MSDWTDERVKELLAMHEKGLSMAQMAAKLTEGGFSISRNAVIGKLHRLGYRRHAAPSAPSRDAFGRKVKFGGQTVHPCSPSPQLRAYAPKPEPTIRPMTTKGLLRAEKPVVASVVDSVDKTLPVSLMALGTGICRFPVGEPEPQQLFCGKATEPEGVYCAACAAKAYNRRPQGVKIYGTVWGRGHDFGKQVARGFR